MLFISPLFFIGKFTRTVQFWNQNLIQSLMQLVMYKGAGQRLFLCIDNSYSCMTFASFFFWNALILFYMNFIVMIFFSYHNQS